jgi:hypothetical protein
MIVEAGGTMVDKLGNRKGRRKDLRVLPHHPDCNAAVVARKVKWEEFHQKAAEDAGFDDDSDDEYEYESSSDEEDSE